MGCPKPKVILTVYCVFRPTIQNLDIQFIIMQDKEEQANLENNIVAIVMQYFAVFTLWI